MKFIAETPEEELLARLATVGHVYVLGFLELMKVSALGGEEDFRQLLGTLETLALQRLDRALALREVGEE